MKGVNICIAAILGMLVYSTSVWPQAVPIGRQTHSVTYSETFRRLKDWPKLFADDDIKIGDLADICAHEREVTQISEAAFELLQVLGSPEFEKCLSRKDLFGRASALTEADFTRFEQALSYRPCEKTKRCKAQELPDVRDSFVYALILDGSDRAQALLRRVYALGGVGMEVGFAPNTLDEALSLISVARQANHTLGPLPNVDSVRAAAFYIPAKEREKAAVKFLGHSSDGNRMLLRVSYVCGGLCGRGYLVVLERHSNGWRHALIAMEWIS